MKIICELIFLGVLCAAAVSDWNTRKIPGVIPALLLIPGILALTDYRGFGMALPEAAAGLLAGTAVLLAPALLVRGSVGGGDIKLMGAAGFFLGPEWGMAGLFLGLLTAACYGVAGILSGRRKRQEPIPLGPFLAFGLSCVSLIRLSGLT